MPQCLRAPGLVFEKNEWSSVHQPGKARRLGSSPGKAVVSQTHRNDLAEGTGKRDFIAYDRGKRKSTNEEDQHKLKRRHLFAGTPPYDANDHDKKEVPEERPYNCRHGNDLREYLFDSRTNERKGPALAGLCFPHPSTIRGVNVVVDSLV